MTIINHNYIIVKQTISEIPSHLLDESDIENYYTHIHALAQYIITTPNCLILPSEINNGKIFRSDIPIKLIPTNDYLPKILENKTDPIWFTTEHPRSAYLNDSISDNWIISCRKVKSEKIKKDKIIGYNFYVNFDGEVDADILCKESDILIKRLNKDLMKLIDNILQLFYKKNKRDEDIVVIPKYKVIREYLTTIDELISAYSYKNGTRNSSYETDRYIANIMMLLFNNIQEIYIKQPGNIFINVASNNITILGYYEGNIRLDPNVYKDDCNAINAEVTIQSQYLSKEVIQEYFYPRDKNDSECNTEYITISNRSIILVGGKNINRTKNITKIRRSRNKTKYRKIREKKNKHKNIFMNWLIEDMSYNKKIFGNWHDRQRYYKSEGKEKLLKIFRENKLVKMRTFIRENRDNMANIEQGYTTYKYYIDDYKKILKEEGLHHFLN